MTGIRMFSAFEIVGFEVEVPRGRYAIWWEPDAAEPWMTTPGLDGAIHVGNRAFDVPPGATSTRRPAMRKAAEEFFAPLLEDVS